MFIRPEESVDGVGNEIPDEIIASVVGNVIYGAGSVVLGEVTTDYQILRRRQGRKMTYSIEPTPAKVAADREAEIAAIAAEQQLEPNLEEPATPPTLP